MDSYEEIQKEIDQEDVFFEPKTRKKEKNPEDNYFQSQMRPYYDLVLRIHGKNNVGLIFLKGMQLFTQRPTMFRESVEWAATNRLHPLQWSKMVNTILKKK